MTPERLQELLNAFADDQLDEAGERELTRALETDEEARRAFARATDQHRSLRELLGRPAAARRARIPWIPLALAAAAVLLVLSFVLLRSPAAPPAPSDVVIRERKPAPAPPPRPIPPPTIPEPTPAPTPSPAPHPEPTPAPAPLPPAPPKEPEKPPAPSEPKSPAPEAPTPKPPAPPPKETAIAIATLESVRGEVYALVGGERKPVTSGQAIASGQGLGTGGGESLAVLVFSDATRIDLRPASVLTEISATAGKRIVLGEGSLLAEVAKQPAGQPMTFSTRHAEAAILGTKLALTCGEHTKLELKEGKARLTRSEDKRAVDVSAGQYAVAGKGLDLTPKRTTRGPMMLGAIWGEDFADPEEVDRDWAASRSGIPFTIRGQLDFDLTPGGAASLGTRAAFAAPFRISADVEFTQRMKGSLVGLRLQSWKQDKEIVHADMDEDRYYLMVGDQSLTADVPRKTPRRERWTLEVAGDGSVTFLVDFKPVLKARRAPTAEEYHVTLQVKSGKDVPPGAHIRFDNLVLERIK